MEETKDERRTWLAAQSRKQLEDGTWPQVLAVFAYQTPRAPLQSADAFAVLKQHFDTRGLANFSAFTDLVVMEERLNGVSMSFNLSMRRRDIPKDLSPAQLAMSMLSTPDILVGTRWGVESAYHWLRNLTQAAEQLPEESFRVFDKVFGEALEHLKGVGKPTSLAQMLEEVMTPSVAGPAADTGTARN